LRVLITNDDGINSEGIKSLAEIFREKHDVWVVAPDKEQSACSHKLTLHEPLRLTEHDTQVYSLDGTPTDCVYMAVHHLMPEKPDVILSGINRGPNLGDDISYSGTVAAALEARVLKINSIAISVTGFENIRWDTSSLVALEMAEKLEKVNSGEVLLLNVNVPLDMTPDGIKYKYCKLGKRNYKQFIVERKDPRGKTYYWIGGDAMGVEKIDNCDIEATNGGFVSVTPISIDSTDYKALEKLENYLK